MSVPLVMAATAAGMGAPAYAAGKEHQASAKAGARRVHPRILRVGDTGPDVVTLQRALGCGAGRDIRPPHPACRAAVPARLHESAGRRPGGPAHGRAGPAGRRPAVAGEVVIRLHDRGPAVAALQRALGVTADGDFGPVTLHAVKAFQAAHGLLVDGQVGPHTRAALQLPPAPTSPSCRPPAAADGGIDTTTVTHHRAHQASSLGARAVALAMRSWACATCGAARARPASTARAWCSTSTPGWAFSSRAWRPPSTGPAAMSRGPTSARRPGLLRPPRPRRHVRRRRPLHPRAAHRHRRRDLVALRAGTPRVRRRHPRG